MVWKTYTNDTDTIQSFIDANGDPVTIEIGETKTFLVERGTSSDVVMSVPPIGEYPVKNLYVDAKTKRVVVNYDDLSL